MWRSPDKSKWGMQEFVNPEIHRIWIEEFEKALREAPERERVLREENT